MTQDCDNIVDCLRSKGIEPEASASSEYDSNQLAKFALVYNSDKQFHTLFSTTPQWWMVDFKRTVSINRYLIQTQNWCFFMYSWNASVSMNNKTWTKVDSQTGYPLGKTFPLSKVYNARYFKVEGSTPQCERDRSSFAFTFIKFFVFPVACHPNPHTCASKRSDFLYSPLIYLILISS